MLMDFAARRAVVSSDVFSTKPVWYSLHGGFHVASYASALERLHVVRAPLRRVSDLEALLRIDGGGRGGGEFRRGAPECGRNWPHRVRNSCASGTISRKMRF